MRAVLHLIRVRQWAKNILLFAGFVFAGRLREAGAELPAEALRVLLAFLCFCALSSVGYVINDWTDIARDRLHPVKKNRPLAAGVLPISAALGLIVFLLAIAFGCILFIHFAAPNTGEFAVVAVAYFALTLVYSFWLKHEVMIDVLALALGFVLRVIAGCLAIPVLISPWIVFCTFSLALFISLCKRRAELNEIGDIGTRGVLTHYNQEMLDVLIAIAAGLTIIGYSFYTFLASHADALGNSLQSTPLLMATIPFVIYGLFRYLFLAVSSPVGGEPERMLRDWKLMLTIALWGMMVVALTILERI
jgi:4-hydroxybenzoate polyprenyltransferase